MDKETVKKELDAIKTVLQHHQEGASIETINRALANDLGLRTLQRRLAVLLENKDIKSAPRFGCQVFLCEI